MHNTLTYYKSVERKYSFNNASSHFIYSFFGTMNVGKVTYP